jgi:hypothetical protein
MPKDKFLNVEQIATLKDKEWQVKPNGFHIVLYAEDYSTFGWEEICKVVGCSTSSTEVTVLGFGFTNK